MAAGLEEVLLLPPETAGEEDLRVVWPLVAVVVFRELLSREVWVDFWVTSPWLRVAGRTVPDEPVDLRLLPDSTEPWEVPDSGRVAGRLPAVVSVERSVDLTVPDPEVRDVVRTVPLSPVDLRPLAELVGRAEDRLSRLG